MMQYYFPLNIEHLILSRLKGESHATSLAKCFIFYKSQVSTPTIAKLNNFIQRFHIQIFQKRAAAVWHQAVTELKLSNFSKF
jgi:hypothetical protein